MINQSDFDRPAASVFLLKLKPLRLVADLFRHSSGYIKIHWSSFVIIDHLSQFVKMLRFDAALSLATNKEEAVF